MEFHITHKTELAVSLSQNISLRKQIALAITFGQATAVLKDFFHLYRESLVCTFHIFYSRETIASDAYSYLCYMSYENFGKIRVSVNFLFRYFYSLLLVDLQILNSQR